MSREKKKYDKASQVGFLTLFPFSVGEKNKFTSGQTKIHTVRKYPSTGIVFKYHARNTISSSQLLKLLGYITTYKCYQNKKRARMHIISIHSEREEDS